MFKKGGKAKGLTVMGSEIAMVYGSGVYEMHSSRVEGEALIPVGAPVGATYTVEESLESVRKITEDPQYRRALTWLNECIQNTDKGDVIVTSYETKVGHRWETARTLGKMDGGTG